VVGFERQFNTRVKPVVVCGAEKNAVNTRIATLLSCRVLGTRSDRAGLEPEEAAIACQLAAA
jgi:hypothetical protein